MKPAMIVVNAENAREALKDLERKSSDYMEPAIYTEIYSDSTLVAVRATSIETARNHTARVLKDEQSRDRYARDNRSVDRVNRRGLSGKVGRGDRVTIVFEIMERTEAETRKNQKLQLVAPDNRVVAQKAVGRLEEVLKEGQTPSLDLVQEVARTMKNEHRYLHMMAQ